MLLADVMVWLAPCHQYQKIHTVQATNNFTHAWHFLHGAMHHKSICHAIVYCGPRQVCCVAHGKWCATRGSFTGSHVCSFWKLPCMVFFIQAATRGLILYRLPRIHLMPRMVHTNCNHRHYSTCTLLYYTIDCKCTLYLLHCALHRMAFLLKDSGEGDFQLPHLLIF